MPHIEEIEDNLSPIHSDDEEISESEETEEEEPPPPPRKHKRSSRLRIPAVEPIEARESGALLKAAELLDAQAKNWQSWSQSMEILFHIIKVGDYVHGRIPRPDPRKDPIGTENWEYNDAYAKMLITNNITPAEKIHTNGAPTANRMWTNLQTMHESTNRLVLTGYMRNLMVHAPEDVNVTEHLGKLNIHWGQVQSFLVYNQKIADTVYKCIIASSLPPAWDGFTDPYVAGKFDEVSDDPKKMMDSQQFIAIIRQEAERKQLRLIQGGANPIYPEQATYVQRSDNPKPPLYKRIAGASTELQSQQ